MPTRTLYLTLGLLALTAPIAALVIQGAPICHLTMTPAEVRGASYRARFTISASCPASTVFRVRKSSTMNLKTKGAPYQPIKPLTGAWEIRKTSTTIPADQLWSLSTWQWQVWDDTAWRPIGSTP